MNPAVTLTMGVLGRLSWVLVPIYMIAQYLGAFVGAACVYSVYIGTNSTCNKLYSTSILYST